MADAIHQYGQIFLGSRGGVTQGQLKVNSAGFAWKRLGGGKTIEVKRDEIDGLYWTKVSRGCQLGVRRKEGHTVNFLGFRDKDLEALQDFCSKAFNSSIKDQPMAIAGRNWGNIAVNNSSLMFIVDGKVAFEVPLPDVSQAQATKEDIMMEFQVDDTAADDKEDTLTEIAFHVPSTNPDFKDEEDENKEPVKVLLQQVLRHTDAGAASSDEAVCTFDEVAVLAPRGRFEVEFHLGFVKMAGQTQDFKIRYTSIMRVFILPKSSTPHTLVVISLDPPIRKGQTYYSHLLCQFNSGEEDEETKHLSITTEQLAAKNEKNGGKLTQEVTGPQWEVFARILRGLSGAKLTKPGAFKNAANDGVAVRCSYKADDGYLYPLERAFFYVHKPPILITHDEVDSVEFQRQAGGVLTSAVKTFDLVVRLKNNQEHQFRNINRTEWQNLFEFIHAKRIRIDNLNQAQHGPGNMPTTMDLGDEMDPGMRAVAAEVGGDSDEEDEDFDAGDSGSGSATESEGDSGSDAEMIAEEGISVQAISKKAKRKGGEGGGEASAPAPKKAKPPAEKPAKPAKAPKAAKGDGEEGGGKKGGKDDGGKKPRKKKDPNAPKKALSAFMYFSNAMRDKIKADNPGIAFGEVGKLLGEKWKAMTDDDKARYKQQELADKGRYASAMEAYKAKGSGGGDDDAEGDDE